MAATSTAWAATRRTRRTAWSRRIVVCLTALLGAGALVVFAATGGLAELRQLASPGALRPVIEPVEGAVGESSPVTAPATATPLGSPDEPSLDADPNEPAVEEEPTADEPPKAEEPPAEAESPKGDGSPADDQSDGEEDDGEEGDAEEGDADGEASLADVQERLRVLGYLVGPADGVQGAQTRAAVMAFQRVNGLQVDGVVGPRTREALADPLLPELSGGPATRIEVDLDRQLLHLVEDGERSATIHVSSGSGQVYRTASGGTARSNTPVGEFTIERRIPGARKASLGTLYDPLYFHRGWAIHGSNSVPAEPASHGCIRVTRADGRWLFERVPDGIPVHIHGGEHVFTPSGV